MVDIAKKSNFNFRQVNQSINVQKNTSKKENDPVISKQERSVSGIVYDENNEGLPGANVVIKGTSSGTITDYEGNYRLNIPDENIVGASYIEIDNAYEENMYLTSGLNTMRLTVAHEFFHAVQRSYRNNLSFGEGYFWEMSSTSVSYTHLTLPTNREV